jgi:hypothetical protein
MENPMEFAGFFYNSQVLGALNHTNKRVIAAGIRADRARVGFGKTAANAAAVYCTVQGNKLIGQDTGIGAVVFKNVISYPGRAFLSYAG